MNIYIQKYYSLALRIKLSCTIYFFTHKKCVLRIWKKISKSRLSCPLDVHTGRVGRKLGLIKRKQNDMKTLIELDNKLRSFDKNDPVKYDFSLFGLGMYEGFW